MDSKSNNRRSFLKACGLSTASVLLPASGFGMHGRETAERSKEAVNFIFDGLMFNPEGYLEKLNEIQEKTPIVTDFYGSGGTT